MAAGNRPRSVSDPEDLPQELRLNPHWCLTQATWRQRCAFQEAARALVRLPAPGEDPWAVLWREADWRRLVPVDDREEVVLAALSQATGIYFFPSREWVRAFGRLVGWLKIRRVLEAGAGRGYLAAVLQPLLASQGIAFKAVDNGQGEFESGLPRSPVVEVAEALQAAQACRPDLVLYAWPPPGQSVESLCRTPGVRYVLVLGEAQGGCTGDPADWQRLRNRPLRCLSGLGVGRTGRRRQAATIFFGSAGLSEGHRPD